VGLGEEPLAWLAVNLVTAFIASRVIGAFEGSIEKLVALAALMPIVAGIGGNSGNQTITMIVRALALGQVQQESARVLLRKEIGVAMVNGLIWGGLLGFVAWWLYRQRAAGAGDDGGDVAQPGLRRLFYLSWPRHPLPAVGGGRAFRRRSRRLR
jgi:Mg/Co/Ni transporter MgtE